MDHNQQREDRPVLDFNLRIYPPPPEGGDTLISVHSTGSPSATLDELKAYRDLVCQAVGGLEIRVEAIANLAKLRGRKAVTHRRSL